jgi:hypothetical protein
MHNNDDFEYQSKDFTQKKPPRQVAVVTPDAWRKRFVAHVIAQSLQSEKVAFELYAGLDFGGKFCLYDLSDSPEDAALEELEQAGYIPS